MRGLISRAGFAVVLIGSALLISTPSQAAAAEGETALKPGCSWGLRDTPDLVNVAFPDEGAHYWGALASGIPETGLIVRGKYPAARYFSLHTYDLSLSPYDSISDLEVGPTEGRNPFARPARLAGKNASRRPIKVARRPGSWEVRILPGERPDDPEPNTIYTGSTQGIPNPGSIVLYRIYVADDPADPEGGAGLPTIAPTVGGRDGIEMGACDLTSGLPESGINEAIKEMNYPGAGGSKAGSAERPTWRKFFGLGETLANLAGAPGLAGPLGLLFPNGGFLSNFDNHYLISSIDRKFGETVVIRARMPSFPDTRDGVPPWKRSKVRYWSICQNHLFTTRYVDCVADFEAVVGKSGLATFVISDPSDRPANATPKDRVNWLAWGGSYPTGAIIYRQMLAARSFPEAIANVEQGQALEPMLGKYMPRAAYCATAVFEVDGWQGCFRSPTGSG